MCKFKNSPALAWKTWMDQICWRVSYCRTRSAITAFKQSEESGHEINLGFSVSPSNDRLESVKQQIVILAFLPARRWCSLCRTNLPIRYSKDERWPGRWRTSCGNNSQTSSSSGHWRLTQSVSESLGTDWTFFSFFSRLLKTPTCPHTYTHCRSFHFNKWETEN